MDEHGSKTLSAEPKRKFHVGRNSTLTRTSGGILVFLASLDSSVLEGFRHVLEKGVYVIDSLVRRRDAVAHRSLLDLNQQGKTCHKPTWFGCGRHIEEALGDVPVDERCHCKAFDQATFDKTGENRVSALIKSAVGR